MSQENVEIGAASVDAFSSASATGMTWISLCIDRRTSFDRAASWPETMYGRSVRLSGTRSQADASWDLGLRHRAR